MQAISIKYLCDDLEVESSITEKVVTPQTADSDLYFFAGMFEEEPSGSDITNEEAVRSALKFKKIEEIKDEVRRFSEIISRENFVYSNTSSNKFWMQKKLELPNLCTMFLIFESINASSAFIERFFSKCGIIVTKRNQNLNEESFNDRVMLCSNMSILNKMK